jgi:hypothetical protein
MAKLDSIALKYIELQEQLLIEGRIDFLKTQFKGKINTSHDKLADHKDSDAIVDHFAENGDPTKKKLYTNWIVNQYNRSGMSDDELSHRKLTRNAPVFQEDAPKIHGILSTFDQFKHKLPKKDINQYDSVKELSDAVEPYQENPDKHTVSEEPHPGRELEHEDENIKIYKLKDMKASQELYGGGSEKGKTDWCTAYTNDSKNMFDRYNKEGGLHVIHDKKKGKVFQYFSGGKNLGHQFMDAKDQEISNDDFTRLAPSLHKAWDEKPHLLD